MVGLFDQSDKFGTETFSTKKVIAHPKFSQSTLDYDYTLIQLGGDSKFRTAELNTVELDVVGASKTMLCTSGWETTSEGSYTLPKILRKVEIPMVSKDVFFFMVNRKE